MMSVPSWTPVTDGGGIVRCAPSRAISPLLVPANIAQITGTSALIVIAISALGLVRTNVMATTATGNDAIGLTVPQCQIYFLAKSRHSQLRSKCLLAQKSAPGGWS